MAAASPLSCSALLKTSAARTHLFHKSVLLLETKKTHPSPPGPQKQPAAAAAGWEQDGQTQASREVTGWDRRRKNSPGKKKCSLFSEPESETVPRSKCDTHAHTHTGRGSAVPFSLYCMLQYGK